MLASSETPRPLPPAKARRASAMKKLSATPPPAYGSPFSFPSQRVRQGGLHDLDGLGSAESAVGDSAFHLGWDAGAEADRYPGEQLPSPPPEDESFDVGEEGEEEWQRNELMGLFVKADGIIKERENELGMVSAAYKGLYQNTVALQSKHQALLARLPMSPGPRATSSPDHTYAMHRDASRNSSISMSTSDSALGLIHSPLYRRHPHAHAHTNTHTRKVSIASADISHLADQNAELLDKLEKLEAEATSADHAGRRELKRLGKEIAFLREALERTQAKSEELEEKVQDAVVGEAWRRKKEREARFRGMRGLGRERGVGAAASGGGGAAVVHPDLSLGLGVRDFAPAGSGFGGPSELTSFFPAVDDDDGGGGAASEIGQSQLPEHALISQLLVKVQELEETNTRILRQQSETATQLSAVQRDTAHITKVYETLADPEAVELELELEDGARSPDMARDRTPSMQTIRFMSLRRTLEDEMSMSTSTSLEEDLDLSSTSFNADGTCIVRPDFLSTAPKNRKSVMGLFDEPRGLGDDGAPGQDQDQDNDDNVFGTFGFGLSSSLSTAHGSSGARPPRTNTNTNTHTNSGALSPLHFLSFSPALTSRPTLQTELNKELGDGDGLGFGLGQGLGLGHGQGHGQGSWSRHNHHLRASSLYDISQFSSSDAGSAPPSPSPSPLPGMGLLRPAGGGGVGAASGRRVSDWDGDEDEVEVEVGDLGEAASTSTSTSAPEGDRDGVKFKLGPGGLKPPQRTPLLMSSNSLRLAVEPPTPDKPYELPRRVVQTVSTPTPADGLNLEMEMDLEATKSPRIKMISETLRARTNRWVERRLRRSRSRSRSDERRDGPRDEERPGEEKRTERDERDERRQEKEEERRPRKKKSMIGDRLSLVVDGLVDRFDTFSGAAKARPKLQSRSRSRSGSRSNSRSRSRRRADKELEEGAGYDEDISEDGSSRAATPVYHDAKSDTHSNSNPNSPLSSPPPEEADDSDPTAQHLHTHKTSSQIQVRKLKNTAVDPNPSLLLQLWLWFQFAIVVLVFVYAMAKRGPTAVLTAEGEGGRGGRAVARRR